MFFSIYYVAFPAFVKNKMPPESDCPHCPLWVSPPFLKSVVFFNFGNIYFLTYLIRLLFEKGVFIIYIWSSIERDLQFRISPKKFWIFSYHTVDAAESIFELNTVFTCGEYGLKSRQLLGNFCVWTLVSFCNSVFYIFWRYVIGYL